MATHLKEFAKSKKHFIFIIMKNRARLEKEYNLDLSKLKPEMIEKRKAYKGYTLRGNTRIIERVIYPEEAREIGATTVWGNWNDYVKQYEGIKPKRGENYYEYFFDIDKVMRK